MVNYKDSRVLTFKNIGASTVKLKKLKIVGYSLLTLAIIAAGAIAYTYKQL